MPLLHPPGATVAGRGNSYACIVPIFFLLRVIHGTGEFGGRKYIMRCLSAIVPIKSGLRKAALQLKKKSGHFIIDVLLHLFFSHEKNVLCANW